MAWQGHRGDVTLVKRRYLRRPPSSLPNRQLPHSPSIQHNVMDNTRLALGACQAQGSIAMLGQGAAIGLPRCAAVACVPACSRYRTLARHACLAHFFPYSPSAVSTTAPARPPSAPSAAPLRRLPPAPPAAVLQANQSRPRKGGWVCQLQSCAHCTSTSTLDRVWLPQTCPRATADGIITLCLPRLAGSLADASVS